MSANDPEPTPTSNDRRPSWELVIEDMQERDRIGIVKYGTPLQAFNGRDPLTDAYQECLDQAVYLRTAIEERKATRAVLALAVETLKCDLRRPCCTSEYQDTGDDLPPIATCLEEVELDQRRTVLCDSCKAIKAIREVLG